MKLTLNYDLIDKIQESQGKYKLQRFTKDTFKYALKFGFGYPLVATVASLIESSNNLITIDQVFINIVLSMGISLSTAGCSVLLVNKLLTKFIGKTKEQIAMEELCALSLKLNLLNIKTSGELLLESTEYYKERKFVLSEKGIPGVIQNKFINIPVYNNGDIEETSILQEHKIGTSQYVLSLGSPNKFRLFKPAYNV